MKKSIIIILVLALSFAGSAFPSEKKIKVGIDEQLGKYIPSDVFFYDELGKKVVLKELINEPTIFAFVYYNCPGICTPLLSEIADVVGKVDMQPNKDYKIITVSMDENETPKIALEKKQNFISLINGEFPKSAWTFLTGDSTNIKKTADAMGFYFERQGTQFLHTGSLIFISPKGKITRYLFPSYKKEGGFRILPFDIKMALIETAEGKTAPTIARVLQYCFSYDPKGKTYMLNITRIFGAGILIMAAIFVGYINLKPKKKKLTQG